MFHKFFKYLLMAFGSLTIASLIFSYLGWFERDGPSEKTKQEQVHTKDKRDNNSLGSSSLKQKQER